MKRNTSSGCLVILILQLTLGITIFAQGKKSYSLFYPVPRLETKTLDPIYGSYYVEGVQVNELIFSRLWTWDEVLSETPDIAKMVPEKHQKIMLLPPKGSQYWRWQVTIPEDLEWPDGEPLTTKDVKFSFDLYRSEQTDYANKEWLSVFKDIRVINDFKMEFLVDAKERNIARYVIPLVQILPEHILLVPSLGRGNSFAKNPLGSGPFQYIPEKERMDIDKGHTKTVFKRNPHYHRWGQDSNLGHVKVIQEYVVSDIVKRLMKAQRTEDWETVDIVLDIPKDPVNFSNIKTTGEEHLNIISYPSNSWYGIAFNCEAPLLNNRDVRMALTNAFDVERVVIKDQYAKVRKGSAWVSVAKRVTGPFNPVWGLGDNKLDEKPISYDIKKSEELLDLSGTWFNKKKKKRYYKDPDTKKDIPISFTLIYNSGRVGEGTPEKSVIGLFCTSLAKNGIGIEVKDVAYDAKNFRKKLESGKGYDMVFQYYEFGWGSNAAPLFTEGDEQNISRFHDPLLDDWFERFNTTTKQKQRIMYSEQIHRYIYENAPYIFLFSVDKVTAFRKELQTLDKVVPLYFFTHIGEWYFEEEY